MSRDRDSPPRDPPMNDDRLRRVALDAHVPGETDADRLRLEPAVPIGHTPEE